MRGGDIPDKVTSFRFPVTVTSTAPVPPIQTRGATGAGVFREVVVLDIYLRK